MKPWWNDVVVLGAAHVGVEADDGVGGQVVGQVGERAGLQHGVVAEGLGHPHPRGGLARHRGPRRVKRRSNIGLQLSLGDGVRTGDVGERAICTSWPASSTWNDERHREDGADGLPGDDAAGDERAAVALPVDLEPDGLGVVAAPDEVRVQRVDAEVLLHRGRRRPEALGHDLPAVEPAPRVLRTDADEHVAVVLLEHHHRAEVHAGFASARRAGGAAPATAPLSISTETKPRIAAFRAKGYSRFANAVIGSNAPISASNSVSRPARRTSSGGGRR